MPQKISTPSSRRPKSCESGIEVLKNLRSSTEMKMSAATIPTKIAASHSMAWMIRSASVSRRKVWVRGRVTASQRRLVLHERFAQAVEHLLRVGTGLLRALGPLVGDGRDGLAPRVDLLGRQLGHLVTRGRPDLRAAVGF